MDYIKYLLVPCSELFIYQVGISSCFANALSLLSQLWPCEWDHLVENMVVAYSAVGRLASCSVLRPGPCVDMARLEWAGVKDG